MRGFWRGLISAHSLRCRTVGPFWRLLTLAPAKVGCMRPPFMWVCADCGRRRHCFCLPDPTGTSPAFSLRDPSLLFQLCEHKHLEHFWPEGARSGSAHRRLRVVSCWRLIFSLPTLG